MVHDILADIVGGVAEAAVETASDEAERRLGCKGCSAILIGLAVIVLVILWALGAFSGA
jgi:hypothetical protein